MNLGRRTTRRWRQKGERGVSPIIATILLVAITVVLAAVLYILISGLTKGPGSTPIGTALALGTMNEASNGASGASARYYYNTSVQTASGGMTWSNMIFQVTSASGSGVAGPTTITTTNAAGSCNVATYTFSTATWGAPASNACAGTTGGSALVVSGAQVQMISTTNLNNAGDNLVAVGQGAFSGTENFQIP